MAAAAGYLAIALLLLSVAPLSAAKPNILFMMADQLRADLIAAAGNNITKTPNVDRLAREGVMFRNAFSSTPTCTPARAAILTGKKPWNHGMLGYGAVAKQYPYEMPRAMAEDGYYTKSIGKDHFGWDKNLNEGISHGYMDTDLYDGLTEEFDDYDQWFNKTNPGVNPMATGLTWNDYRGRPYALPEYYHPTAWVGRAAVDFLDNYNRSEPFMLKVSFHRPHSPYDPPKRLMDIYNVSDMPAPYQGSNWDNRFAIKYNTTPSPGIWCGDIGLDVVKHSRQAYYGSVTFVDEWVGHILGALQQRGWLESTLILFTADHGDMIGDHYHFRKGFPYEGSAHIPMLIRWPDTMTTKNHGPVTVSRGIIREEPVELRDLFPTFLDAAASRPSKPLDGQSLLNLLSDNVTDGQWREYVDLEHDVCYNVTNHWNALTDGHMKYVFRAYFGDEQLFDLDNDPHEMTNLAGNATWEKPLELWRSRMVKQFQEEGRGPDWVSPDGKLMRRIKGQLYSPNYPRK
ncbi:arylsulfatase-like [Corticium candelabrum]|uniref:arylsulfatase-like n=1 Tax=Corticium candelabrum TaxID=121492 RepID=UPI002E26309D|nr:arylsulfatase-like [Corticium candelabrum]